MKSEFDKIKNCNFEQVTPIDKAPDRVTMQMLNEIEEEVEKELETEKLNNMKRMYGNEKLQKNFSLYEYLMGTALSPLAISMNWNFLNNNKFDAVRIINKIKEVSAEHQKLRDLINMHFQGENGEELGIEITSGFRCLEWEHHQGRSGLSQHTTGNAIDFQVTNAKNEELYNRIMYCIMDWYEHFVGGLATKKKGDKFVFIHIDYRGKKARWEY